MAIKKYRKAVAAIASGVAIYARTSSKTNENGVRSTNHIGYYDVTLVVVLHWLICSLQMQVAY
jgi:hypothetical protein